MTEYDEYEYDVPQEPRPPDYDELGDDGEVRIDPSDVRLLLDPDAPEGVHEYLYSLGIATGNLSADDLRDIDLSVTLMRMVESPLRRGRIVPPAHERAIKEYQRNLFSDIVHRVQFSKAKNGFGWRQLTTSTRIAISTDHTGESPIGDRERGLFRMFRSRR